MAKRLSDLLKLTVTAAAEQWQRILRRRPAPRQEAYLPIEILLCFGLFQVVDPHGFGGANIHAVPTTVKALAATLSRSPGSLLSKMLNLDGSRTNAGRFEVDLFLALSSDTGVYPALYASILLGAREAGITEDRVPDFLGWLDPENEEILLGQDEIGSREIEIALGEASPRSGRLRQDLGLTAEQTERLVEARVRRGQDRFARRVLQEYDHRCGFCGFSPAPLPRSRLLFASHIKPWRDSTPRERLDPRNGIAACPNHDAAFDGGLLTVNGGQRIHRCGSLERLVVRERAAERYFGEDALRTSLVLPPGSDGPARVYLDYHKEHIFRGN